MLLGEQRIKALVDQVLRASQAEHTEVIVFVYDSQLTRFANNGIHQNVAERDVSVRVRAIVGNRQGVASTNDLSPAGIAGVAETALALARLQPEADDPPPLADATAPASLDAGFDEATAACSAARRAEAVRVMCALAKDAGLIASGLVGTETLETVVANDQGLFAYDRGSVAEMKATVMSDDSSGTAEEAAWRLGDLDPEAIGREAVERAVRGRNPRPLPAGTYPVVLECYAVADMLSHLGILGFNALAVQEGRSFLEGKIGQTVMHPSVSIWDDATDPTGLPRAYDWEGVRKRRLSLVEAGVARGVVYDLATARKDGVESTGHGLPAPNPRGPIPGHMFMAPGEATVEEMIAGMDRGLYVSTFHYTRAVHPKWTVVTGMTRDGTYWIEGGEIAYPVRNLRFTQSYVDALAHVEAVGRETRLIRSWQGGCRVPAIRVSEFTFTGTTEF
ncbi:MAG: TldD/PmbA family protein [Chloroflexi bacterium]|nr:TldD/PmbA family protein [Chloroflexota bacterium]